MTSRRRPFGKQENGKNSFVYKLWIFADMIAISGYLRQSVLLCLLSVGWLAVCMSVCGCGYSVSTFC